MCLYRLFFLLVEMVLMTLGDANVTRDGWAGRMMSLVGLGAEWVL